VAAVLPGRPAVAGCRAAADLSDIVARSLDDLGEIIRRLR
jgi:hypothetical protein